MTHHNRWRCPSIWAGLLVVIAAILLYLLTLDNGLRPDELVGGDLITHQYAQVEGRPSNAPGYPLYTMGGWLWYRLAWLLLRWAFNPTELLSLYSLLWGAASLTVLYLILRRVTRGWLPVAVLLTAFHATTYFFWYYSITTEQYTSAVFQTLLLIWLAFRWDDRPRDSTLLWIALISGTMLANMLTTLFILPPLLWFILFRPDADRTRRILIRYLQRPRLILAATTAGILPALSYAYVYIRGAQHPEWRDQGQWNSAWAWFVHFLTIPQGRDELAPGLTLQHFFTAEFPSLMWQELTLIVFLGGLVGLAFLGRRRAIFLYSTLAIYAVFCWAYRFGNWFQVIIPAYPIFVIGFAAGLTHLRRVAARRGWAQAGIYLLLAGLAVYRLNASLPRANQRNRPEDTGLVPGWEILADNPQSPAIISTVFDEWAALQYLQIVWRLAPGILPTAAGNLSPPGDMMSGAPPRVYTTRRAAAAAPQATQSRNVHPQAAGVQLIELLPEPRQTLPPTATRTGIQFGDRLYLAGWEPLAARAPLPVSINQPNWQIALYWQAVVPLTVDYTISVRPLVNGQPITIDGQQLIQDHQPVWGIYPTSRWQVGEIVRDVYALSLPDGAEPEAFQVVVYFATEAGFENIGAATLR